LLREELRGNTKANDCQINQKQKGDTR